MNYITIKDADGVLRPARYIIRKDWHGLEKTPKLSTGENFVEVEIVEIFAT
jgi:hypothetical protein